MNSYRESSFDPNGENLSSRPRRPFNAVQWAGAGFIGIGVGIMLAVIAGKFGLLPVTRDSLPMVTSFCALGTVLINVRREAVPITAATKRRRILIISIAAAACAVVAIFAFYFQGTVR